MATPLRDATIYLFNKTNLSLLKLAKLLFSLRTVHNFKYVAQKPRLHGDEEEQNLLLLF